MIRGVQTIGAAVAIVVASTIAAAAGQSVPGRELQLSFNADGTVNLKAQNVSARDILIEWRRQCQCHVINAEQLPGGAIMLPLQFENAPQGDVLRSLLRSAAGFVLTPQRPGTQSASNYETIYILATSHPVAGAYVPPPVQAGPVAPTPGGPDDELPPVVPAVPVAPPPAPAAQPTTSQNPFGSRSTESPFVTVAPAPGPATTPGAPIPAPTPPGMPVPAPGPAPGQPPPPPPSRPGTVVAPVVPVQSNP